MRFKSISIQWKIAFFTAFYILIVLFGSIIFAVWNFEKNLVKERESSTVNNIISLIESYKDFFILRNLEKIDEMVRSISSLVPVEEVTVLDTDGRIIGHTDISLLGKFEKDILEKFKNSPKQFREVNSHFVFLYYPVLVDTTPVGYVVSRYDKNLIKASVDFDILKIAVQTLFISSFVIVASFIGTFFISGFMIRPIRILKDKIVNLTSDIDKPLSIDIPKKKKLPKDCIKNISEECWLTSDRPSEIMLNLGDLALKECQNCEKYKKAVSNEIEELTYSFYMMVVSLQDYLKKLEEAYKERETLNCLASMGEMSAKVAHEIKNALYAIGNAANYMRSNVNNPLVKEFSTVIKNEVNRLNEMTVSFLNFSKLIEPQFSYDSVNQIIKDSIRLIKEDFENEGIELLLELEENLPPVKLDRNLFRQVVFNLSINALEALREKKNGKKFFRIKTYMEKRYNNSYIKIIFEDNGIGIPEEMKDKIFKPFFSTKPNGTGLGLPIVYKIVFSHGWIINMKSEEGKGTEFSIEIKI